MNILLFHILFHRFYPDSRKKQLSSVVFYILIKLKAFVLLNTELGKEASVMDALRGVEGIRGMHVLYGVYDLIVEVEAEGLDRVKEVVFNKVRILEHVVETVTLLTHGEPITNE
jgi:DNA-binding Lrp family transcriptional regulator